MAGGNLKRPTNASPTATDAQTRSKKTKNTGSKDGPELALQSELFEMMIEPGDGDVDDFEDDPTVWNPIASQLSKAIENVKKPDPWPRDFARSVKERQSALLEELKVKCQAMSAGQQKFASQFHNIVAVALAPAGSELASASHLLQINHITPAGQPLHKKSSALLEESKTLLAHYQHLTLQHSTESSHLEDLAKNFATDKEQTAQAVAAGRRVADADIDDMLADRLHEVRGRKPITADDETLGREVLRIGRNQRPEPAERDNESWGKVAHRAQKAVEKLYKVSIMEE